MASLATTPQPGKPMIPQSSITWAGERDPLHIARTRQEGAAAYRTAELPTRVGHVWKHANPAGFIPSVEPGPADTRFMESHERGEKTEVEFLVGSDLFVTLSEEAATNGVQVTELSRATAHIGSVVPAQRGFFEAMNQTLWSSGIHIHVPAGVQLSTPIHLNISTDARFPFVRLFVQIDEGASATLLEHISSSWHRGPSIMVAETEIAHHAVLHHGFIYDQREDDVLHYSHGGHIQDGGHLQLIATTIGTGRFKGDFAGILAGRHAHSDIRTFALLDGKTQVDFHTRQHHLAALSTSDMKSRSILLDHAVSSNTGLIRIEEAARDCEAYQIARNLMLSQKAHATTIPELEIENNDVVCSHGAATGTLDEGQLFYLMSRGLSKTAATRLIVEGAFQETLHGFSPSMVDAVQSAHAQVWERISNQVE